MKGTLLIIVLLAVVAVIAFSNISYAMENTGNFTAPNITLIKYVYGRVLIRANWTSMGIGRFNVKLYSGLSPSCLKDTNFVMSTNTSSLPYPGGPNSPVPTSSFIWANAMLNINRTGTVDYVCMVANDSGGYAKNSTAVLVNISLIPPRPTTTSTTSYNTTTSLESTASTTSYPTTTILPSLYKPRPQGPIQVIASFFRWLFGLG